MGAEGLGGDGETVALFVGGLGCEFAASCGVGAWFCVEAEWPTGDVAAVLWCRRRWRDGDDVHDGIVRGARKSRIGAWPRANACGENIRADMFAVVVAIVE
jgi:hypothetical protein